MSDECETQPALIDYARFHGLADNHLSHDTHTWLPSGLIPCNEDARLPDFKVPQIERLPPEAKFRLDSKAALLLASCLKPPPAPDWSNNLSDHHRVKRLKFEQPALKTDHANDMRKIRYRTRPKTEALNLVSIEVDAEGGEGLAWPPEMMEVATILDKKVAEEKFQTTREVLKALQDSLRPAYTAQMHEAIVAEDLAFTKVWPANNRNAIYTDSEKGRRPEPISPPLLSSEYSQEPHIPSSPTLRMQLLSDVPDPDDELMHKANEDISTQCRIRIDDATAAEVDQIEHLLQFAENGPAADEITTLDSACQQSPIGRTQHAKFLKLKLPEVEPSSRPETNRGPSAKQVTFAFSPKNVLLEYMKCEEPSSDDTDQPFKDDLLAQLAYEASPADDKELAGERLEPSGIIMRVEVPKLHEIKLTAPGTTITSKEFLQTMIENHLKYTRTSFDKTLERKMEWAPVPSGLLNPVIDDPIQPSPQLSGWTSQPAFAIKSEDLLWRPDVLRILSVSEEDDEEELEKDFSLQDKPSEETRPPLKRPALKDLTKTSLERPARPLSLPEIERRTSGFGSLAGFMDTRKAHKKPRLDPEEMPTETTETKATSALDAEMKTVSRVQVPATPTERHATDVAALVVPQVPIITSPRSIIVNSKLLKSHRQVTQALETRPNLPLVIIYRDLETSNDADIEADLIITPTTAAIFTTLQATTQRSLPGQGPSRPPIFNRIVHLSQLYDRLLVLTTLRPADSSPLESPTTCSQISTLTSFCTSLSVSRPDSTVQPILIPTPSPPEPDFTLKPTTPTPHPLYQWTYPLIIKHALDLTSTSTPGITLLAEETLWELFLRKAGMNPFAAQVVLGMLKKPHGEDLLQRQKRNSGLWGLRAFVQMEREERMEVFGKVVGRRAVERVGDVLGVAWGGGAEGGGGGFGSVDEDLGREGECESACGVWEGEGEAMLVD